MKKIIINVNELTIQHGDFILMKDISFKVYENDIFIIMGASGCGKSSLLRILTGLDVPIKGQIFIDNLDLIQNINDGKNDISKRCGILYQSGALFSSMTLEENVALPLEQYTSYSKKTIRDIVLLKLALVGLTGFEDFYPSEISGGMRKRAGLARALALDPKIVYCDELSAGLDPVSSKLLDDLILGLNDSLKTTFVIVTHELASILTVGNNSIFLDVNAKTISGYGDPKDLMRNPPNKNIRNFLTRGSENA